MIHDSDGIILLHGIGRSKRSMQPLEKFLITQGYHTLNLDYPSTRMTIQEIALLLRPAIQKFSQNLTGKVHFVAYSMGGLVARAILMDNKPANLGRIVMMGTPNSGSEVADKLQKFWLYKKFYGPAGQQLVTKTALLHEKIDYELGIIAGDRPLDLISSLLIGAPNDGKVSVESTKLQGMKDHLILKTDHMFMLINQKAWQAVLTFLQKGRFH